MEKLMVRNLKILVKFIFVNYIRKGIPKKYLKKLY